MSTLLRKKIKKKKKKKVDNSNEIVPQRHEREGNLNYYSEEVAKNMIEKLISLSISAEFVQNIDKKFPQFCIDKMSRQIDTLTEIMHINREKDDFDVDNIDINSYITYYKTDTNVNRYKSKRHDKACEKRNDLAEGQLMEIANIANDYKTYMNVNKKKIEDCLNNSINIKKNKFLKNGKLIQYSIDIDTNNFWGDVPQPESISIDRTTSKFNAYVPRVETKKNSASPKKANPKSPNRTFKKKTTFYYKSGRFNDYSKSKDLDAENANKKRRGPLVNLPSYPIENLEIRKESEEILFLRKQTLEILSQKEKELKELKQRRIKINKQLEKEKQKKKKGKYTIDTNGNLIPLNEIKPENLFKEFWPIMSKPKEIKAGKTLDFVKKERIKLELNAKKNIQYNEDDRPYQIYLLKSRIHDTLNEFNSDNHKEKDNSNSNENSNSLNQKENKKKIFDEFNTYIEPSGSNFKLMMPALGVMIKEKQKVKSGGTDFYQKFHKYSINEFNKTLQDTIEWSKFKAKERQSEGYMIQGNPLPNSNKIVSIKEEKEADDSNRPKISPAEIRQRYSMLKNFQQTYTSGFHKHKPMAPSKSQIYSSNDNFPKLKRLLFHEDQNERFRMMKLEKMKEVENVFRKGKKLTLPKNRSAVELKTKQKNYNDVDDFNKQLVMGKVVPERTNNKVVALPKIGLRTGENFFSNTMTQFHRTRIKKVGYLEEIPPKKSKVISSKKKKETKKINSDDEN